MDRIAALPERDWAEIAPWCVAKLTPLLKTPNGQQTLRDEQAVGLFEAYQCGGAFIYIKVGGGKTLLAGLVPVIMGSKRPLLIVPGGMLTDTEREHRLARVHWRIPATLRTISYNMLSRKENIDDLGRSELDRYQPDLVIADEVHRLKNWKPGDAAGSAVASRFGRWREVNPSVPFIALTGSITDHEPLDYMHLINWTLGNRGPVPLNPAEQRRWSACLGDRMAVVDFASLKPALGMVRNQFEARRKYRKRLASTPGVIFSTQGYEGSKMTWNEVMLEPPDRLREAFDKLRKLWFAPDDYPLGDARFQVWNVVRQVALGYYLRKDPRPEPWWIQCRRDHAAQVRYFIERGHGDTEAQIIAKIDAGELPDRFATRRGDRNVTIEHALSSWRAALEKFPDPPTKFELLDDFVVRYAAKWAKGRQGGLIWVKHLDFGEHLSRELGLPFFQQGGICKDDGANINDETGARTVIVSSGGNSEGRNLQYSFHQNLILDCTTNAKWIEQQCGRTHRSQQPESVVTFDVVISCFEHLSGMRSLWSGAEYVQETTGPQKILNLDEYNQAQKPENTDHPAWSRTESSKEDYGDEW